MIQGRLGLALNTRTSVSIPRYNSLDQLRATMMLLGVVRHAAMSYEPTVFEGWPYRDAQADMLVGWVINFIRVFQLPVFFAISGFFAAYLVESRGILMFLRHRWSRIGVPFLVAWPILAISMYFILRLAAPFSSIPPNYAYNMGDMMSPRATRYLFMHLWFLYHLMILCVSAGAITLLLRLTVPESLLSRARDVTERLLNIKGIGILILLTILILYRMLSWSIDYDAGPLPPVRMLMLFGLFFAFGWLLYRRRELLEKIKRPAWVTLAIGMLCCLAYLFLFELGCNPDPGKTCTGTSQVYHLGTVVLLSLSMWLLTFALFGLFLRYMTNTSRRWRYLADASYWIYIVHVPIVMLLPLLLANIPLPGIVKLALVVLTATGLILLAYRYFVRPTFIGEQLNGRRYPRVAV